MRIFSNQDGIFISFTGILPFRLGKSQRLPVMDIPVLLKYNFSFLGISANTFPDGILISICVEYSLSS